MTTKLELAAEAYDHVAGALIRAGLGHRIVGRPDRDGWHSRWMALQ